MKAVKLLTMIAFLGFCTSCLAYTPATFDCRDAEGGQYQVVLGKTERILRSTQNGKVREVKLASPNLGRPASEHDPLVYDGWNWNAKGKYFSHLDFGNEFVTQFETEKGKTRLKVGLVVDHRDIRGLSCSVSGAGMMAQPEPMPWDPVGNNARLIQSGGSLRNADGSLTLVGVRQSESAVRRVFASPGFDQKARDRFAELSADALKKIAPGSIQEIGRHLSGEVRTFWEDTLKQVRYAYHPESKRYAVWVVEGLRPAPWHDPFSVRAGFVRFVSSGVGKEKELREIFVSDILPAMKTLSEPEAESLQSGLDETTAAFFRQVWNKATGKRTLADFPDVQQMIERIKQVVETDPKSFDAERAQNAIMGFFRSPRSKEPDAREAFLRAASPLVRRLSGRQQEDILVWLPQSEKTVFQHLVGRSPASLRR